MKSFKNNIYIYYRMHIKKYTPQLLDIIGYAKRDKDLELEVLVKSSITSETFYNTVKGLKGNKLVKQVDELESLDIIADEENIRVSILGSAEGEASLYGDRVRGVRPQGFE